VSLGLYLHVPFCQAICSYCNFNRGLLDGDLKRQYVNALEQEIRSSARPHPRVERDLSRPETPRADTIFFGGGTPSLLEPGEVARLLRACGDAFSLPADPEITVETNPETATLERLCGFREAGVNRISFGVQSFDDDMLARLGRVHSAERARTAVRMARAAGFDNVSLDLMFWLPGQTLASWLGTVDEAVALEPDHLSLYLLELYPNAPLKESLARTPQADDDIAAEMYLEALSRLDAAGFEQYEISNVARPGRASRHNLKYWHAGEWHGFGCGAHSTVDGHRWKNIASTRDYVDRIAAGTPVRVDERRLLVQERFEECLFTGLRLSEGIGRQQVQAVYGVDPWSRFSGDLEPFVENDLMWVSDARFGLTRRGMLVANDILSTFV
jgi:oxygen-independent coproporphyrinogen-3 oxidase